MTQRHSRNAVAAKARLRLQRGAAGVEDSPRGRVFTPRPTPPDFVINIRARRGDRLQISVWRGPGGLLTADGPTSARKLARGLEALLREAA